MIDINAPIARYRSEIPWAILRAKSLKMAWQQTNHFCIDCLDWVAAGENWVCTLDLIILQTLKVKTGVRNPRFD